MDVEGEVCEANPLFFMHTGIKGPVSIYDLIASGSKSEMEELLDRLLSNPKAKGHFLMRLESSSLSESIWWEFSMVVNQEKDPLGFFGIGLPLHYLEDGLPLEHLLDLLDYGVIKVDSKLNLLESDAFSAKLLHLTSKKKKRLESLLSFLPKELDKLKSWDDKEKFLQLEATTLNNVRLKLTLLKQAKDILILIGPDSTNGWWKSPEEYITQEALELIPGPVWVVNEQLILLQSNSKAALISEHWTHTQAALGMELNLGQRVGFYEKILQKFNELNRSEDQGFDWKVKTLEKTEYWQFRIKKVNKKGVFLIQGVDLTPYQKRVEYYKQENQQLRELAVQPSYILRSPLSSMLGLLDLIDSRKLDSENKKYFAYLRPLAEELDQVIRTNAKQVAQFD